MRTLIKLVLAAAVIFVILQFIRPSIPAKPATAEIQAPPQVKAILQKDCYSCHSDERRLSWFDQIVPAYWFVRHDVLEAREHLNFSTLGSKPAAAQKATLYEAVNMIQLGAMPLPKFTALHPEAKVTTEDLNTLKTWLAPWGPTPPAPAAPAPAATSADYTSVKPEFNGVAFDPFFINWKLISITDRGDNNTFRFILGNDVAFNAAQSGNISPWPNGSRLAKIAWQQQPGSDGLIHAGNFIQIELMIKDSKLYKSTEGWSWGRWRGSDLKPYGKDAGFVTECTTCHLPVHGNDYVYTLPITTAKLAREEVVNNTATLPSTLPFQPLSWTPVTMYVDPKNHTMSMLFSNQPIGNSQPASYPTGTILALVTWIQRDDPHWFGARIPSTPQSVEFLQIDPSKIYHRYTGPSLTEDTTSDINSRINFILGLTPAPLP